MLLKKPNNFQRSISLASEMKDFLSQIHTNSHSKSSLLWFELPHQHNYKRFWARMGTFKPRQASKLLHPFYFQQAEPVGAQLIFPKMLRAAHAVAGKRLLLPNPCTWNRQQHLRSKQTRRASRNGRLLPRCLCKKMERTCLSAFTGRSLTIQWYILKNKRFSHHYHTKAPDKCVSAFGRRRVDIHSLTDVRHFLQKTKRVLWTHHRNLRSRIFRLIQLSTTCIIEFCASSAFPQPHLEKEQSSPTFKNVN